MQSTKLFLPVLLFFVFQFQLSAQTNLVPNGGFEAAGTCPNYPGQINYATGWNNVNLVYNSFSVGTPDFFHACGTSSAGYSAQPPATFAGTCTPNTGSGFSALVMYNTGYADYREYMSTQLSCPMVSGGSYTVSFYLTNGTGVKSPYIIKNIGAYFSSSPLTQSGWGLINLTPQCEITAYSGTNSWVKYTFVITATANWNYITLGCFRPDASNGPMYNYSVPGGPNSAYANYYFDDIQVLGPPNSSLNLSTSTTSINCNGQSTGSASVSTTSTLSLTYNWQPGNISGQTINNVPAGTYTVSASSGTCDYNTQIITIPQPQPIVVSVDPLTICQGGQGPLTANVSGGTPGYSYYWSTGSNSSGIIVSPTVTTTYFLNIIDANGCFGSTAITVTVTNCSTGIHESQNVNSISFHPNPFTTVLSIDSKVKYDEIIVTDLLGKTVKKITSPVNSIDMSDMQNGIYFITISENRKTICTKKAVKTE